MTVRSIEPAPSVVRNWRADTPGCGHVNHLNNAGAGLMPSAVLRAITKHLELETNLGGYEAADAVADQIDSVYADLAALMKTKSRNVAIVGNATQGFIQAVSTIDFASGDAILTSRSDYTSNQIQYLALSKRLGVEVIHVPDLPEGGIDPAAAEAILRSRRIRLAAVTWVPTNSGLVQDVHAIGRACATAGVPFIVDACQAVGQIDVDLTSLQCDYLSATARKFLRGPRGIGFMYASDSALERGDHPLFVDMRGAMWSGPTTYSVHPTARRFEDWEFPYALVLGLGSAVKYAASVGIDRAQSYAWALADRARRGLASIPGVRVLDRGAARCAIVTFDHAGVSADRIVRFLRDQKINVALSPGWVGLLDFADKSVVSAVRASPHYYNTEEEVDALVTATNEFVSPRGHSYLLAL